MTRRAVLLLTPASWGPAGIRGSSLTEAGCGHLCWIAPSGQRTLLRGDAQSTRCVPCTDFSQATGYVYTPEQEREMSAHMGPAMTRRILAALEDANRRLIYDEK